MPDIHPNENSYVIDPESAAEMARLLEMDHMLNKHMGGLLPEDIDLSTVHDILDIACGPGGWVQEVAFAYPQKRVVGIDISQTMLSYARAQAAIQGLDNTSFLFMDATAPLQFPDNSFDMVNTRFLGGFLWKEAWPKLVAECVRITCPGGIIRLTETDTAIGITNSVALENMNRMLIKAGYRTGRSFHPTEDSYHGALTPMLRTFLEQGGCHLIRQIPYMIDYSANSPDHAAPSKNLRLAMKLLQPFLLKLGIATSAELESIYQQLVEELESDDFRGISYFISAYGQKPG
jgi:ubiquinone/menaquinone biosynthesis C-methylase UbiE